MTYSLAGILSPTAPINPILPGISTPTATLVTTPTPTASPPPTIVYEPSPASKDDAPLTYSPPSAPPPDEADDGEPMLAQEEGAVTLALADSQKDVDAGEAQDESGVAMPQEDAALANDAFVASVVAMTAAANLHGQFVNESRHLAVTEASPGALLSVDIARTVQSLPATPPAETATLPSLASAATASADAQGQSQVMAQAAYALVADAWVQDRIVLDPVKFA